MVDIKQGKIVWLDFDPQAGHEQKGRRPALIVSNRYVNELTKFKSVMLCPITSTNRAFPLHVDLDHRTKTTGTIMCEQVKMLDVSARNVEPIEDLPPDLLVEVLYIIQGFSEMEL